MKEFVRGVADRGDALRVAALHVVAGDRGVHAAHFAALEHVTRAGRMLIRFAHVDEDGVGMLAQESRQAGRIELHRGAPLATTMDALRVLPGIGEWTVQLIALRALAWPDAFPATDIGVLNALGTRDVKSVEALAERWRPWRGYAVMRLWRSLETGT